MPRGVRRFSLLSGVALCAVLGGPIAVAQASDTTIKQTLNSFAPKIVKDESAVANGLKGYPKTRLKLTHALKHEVGDLHSLKSKLSHDSASSPAGAKAKKDIIKGLGLIATAYGNSAEGRAGRERRRRSEGPGDRGREHRQEGAQEVPGRTQSAQDNLTPLTSGPDA